MSVGEQYLRLGDMLLRRGVLDRRKLDRGLRVSQESKRRIGDVLIDMGYVDEDQIAQCLADQYGFELEDISQVKPTAAALSMLTPEFALKWCVLALEDDIRFRCVVSDPVNIELTDTIAMIARKPLSLSLAPRTPLLQAIRAAYGLPALPVAAKSRRRRKPPEPETVLQRDRTMLLDAVYSELSFDEPTRRVS